MTMLQAYLRYKREKADLDALLKRRDLSAIGYAVFRAQLERTVKAKEQLVNAARRVK